MKDREIALVQESWAQIIPITGITLERYYECLFELDENIAKLFVGKDMAVQSAKLAGALNLAIEGLNRPDALTGQLQELGERHTGYGVTEDHFETVGIALLMTLEEGLSSNWTKAHEQSWSAAWAFVASQMLCGLQARKVT